jgi:hypothetical protein
MTYQFWYNLDGKAEGVVQVKDVASGEVVFLEKADLTRSENRSRIAEAIAKKTGLAVQEVESELASQAAEEEERRAAQRAARQRPEQPPAAPKWEPAAQDLKRAEALLKDPNLLPKAVDLIERLGVVGERVLAATLYVAGTSRVLKKPLYVLIRGAASSGKSFIQRTVASLFPSSVSVFITDPTAQSFYYLKENISHKVVWLGERKRQLSEEAVDSTKAIRELVEAGYIVKQIPRKRSDGVFETMTIEVKGPIALIESCSHDAIPEEDRTRQIAVWTNDAPELTRQFMAAYAARKAGDVDLPAEEELAAWLALQHILEPTEVLIPFASELAQRFPAERVECRRAFVLFLAFIEAIAALYCRQRETRGGKLIAAPEDAQTAEVILQPWLATTLPAGVSPSAAKAWEWVKGQTGPFRRKDLEAALGMPERTAREAIRELLRKEAIGPCEQRGVYRVLAPDWNPQRWAL